MSNGYLTTCALIISILITIIFFVKKPMKNMETNIFKKMLFINIAESFTTTLIVLTAITVNSNFLLSILNRIDVMLICTWCSLMYYYIYNISSAAPRKKNRILFLCINLIICVSACFLKVNIVNENNVLNSTGPLTSLGLIGAIFYILAMIWVLIFMKNKNQNLDRKKFIPLYFLILLLVIVALLRTIIPEINLISIVLSLVNMLMVFTIENPDMKMIEQLNTAKDAAEKANRAKSDFLSSMSHEIRTPLNAIVGFSECILNENDLESAKGDAKDIIMASQNLLEIVNGILDISKIEADKMEIVEAEYSLKGTLNSLVKLTIPRIGEKPIEFKTKFAADIPPVLYGDSAKVKQIITNILTNAVKYTERGIITFEVNCINKDNICSLVISVEDTGRGIKADKLDTIFNKFERLEEDRNTTLEGTGLGLAITKRLVEMMGGKIVVQSKYGSGSKFTVYLKQEIRNTPIKQEKSYIMTVANADFSNKKVLVVDDNKINLKVATRMLEPFKIQVEECMSGEECIAKIKEGITYDLILMDDMMPRITGTETFHELEKIEHFNTPVVVLTANAIEGMKEKYLQEGFTDYLAKPIDKLELERVLGTYLVPYQKQKEEDIFEPLPEELFDMNVPLKEDE